MFRLLKIDICGGQKNNDDDYLFMGSYILIRGTTFNEALLQLNLEGKEPGMIIDYSVAHAQVRKELLREHLL